ncbi:MAG: 30S ribosomal protein S16 [bacterium]
MVKLRLRRKGRRHFAVYDVVAIDGRKRRDGAYLERLGFYDPNTKPSTISIDPDRAIYWLNVGAQPTPIVNNLLKYEGILLRRAMGFKEKNQVEIEEAVKLHKEKALERYHKEKADRKNRKEAKLKAEEDTKKSEAEAAEKAKQAEAAEKAKQAEAETAPPAEA